MDGINIETVIFLDDGQLCSLRFLIEARKTMTEIDPITFARLHPITGISNGMNKISRRQCSHRWFLFKV